MFIFYFLLITLILSPIIITISVSLQCLPQYMQLGHTICEI